MVIFNIYFIYLFIKWIKCKRLLLFFFIKKIVKMDKIIINNIMDKYYNWPLNFSNSNRIIKKNNHMKLVFGVICFFALYNKSFFIIIYYTILFSFLAPILKWNSFTIFK